MENKKQFRKMLKEKCAICNHEFGVHDNFKRCDDCYKENINYKNHVFKLKRK